MIKKLTIFILEDDENILNSNRKILEWEGYETIGATSVKMARELIKTTTPDAFILDVNLPDGSGVDFCKEIRNHFHGPVLFLTAMNEKSDVLKGLRAGGSEYIAKPFDVDELLARLEALLDLTQMNREDREDSGDTSIENLHLDLQSLRAYVDNEDIGLTPREFSVLHYLLSNHGRKTHPENIYRDVWMDASMTGMSSLYRSVSVINKKLTDSGAKVCINNYRGEGYMIETVH